MLQMYRFHGSQASKEIHGYSRISIISKYSSYLNSHDVWISGMSKYPWCSNISDAWISLMSKHPWCLNINDLRISMISNILQYDTHEPRQSIFLKIWIPFSKKSHYPGSQFSREVNLQDVLDVQISAIYNTKQAKTDEANDKAENGQAVTDGLTEREILP